MVERKKNKGEVVSAEVFLGIDPGFSVTGYTVLKKDGRSTFLMDYGYLQMSSQKSLAERVGIFHATFEEKIKLYNVTQVALETSFLYKNPQTFLKLGYLRGILYLLSSQHNLSISEFSPAEVKRAVTGSGSASKDQVALALVRLFPALSEVKKAAKNDVTDALAISLCGLWKHEQHVLLR